MVGCCTGQEDNTTRSPVVSKHSPPSGPHRISDFEFSSQCYNKSRRIPLPKGRMKDHYLDPRHGAHGYLTACPGARGHADEPPLQAPPTGAVRTAGCAHIVQLQMGRDSSC